jgi:hypothetical protein
MPGVVPLASVNPVIVMPKSLCTAFEAIRTYDSLTNVYANGERQTEILVTNSRRFWKQKKLLPYSLLIELRAFWEIVRMSDPFYYYDPYMAVDNTPITPVGSNYDAGGGNAQGRFCVRFNNHWSQSTGIARSEVGLLELVELAEAASDATGFVPAAMG